MNTICDDSMLAATFTTSHLNSKESSSSSLKLITLSGLDGGDEDELDLDEFDDDDLEGLHSPQSSSNMSGVHKDSSDAIEVYEDGQQMSKQCDKTISKHSGSDSRSRKRLKPLESKSDCLSRASTIEDPRSSNFSRQSQNDNALMNQSYVNAPAIIVDSPQDLLIQSTSSNIDESKIVTSSSSSSHSDTSLVPQHSEQQVFSSGHGQQHHGHNRHSRDQHMGQHYHYQQDPYYNSTPTSNISNQFPDRLHQSTNSHVQLHQHDRLANTSVPQTTTSTTTTTNNGLLPPFCTLGFD